MHDASLFGSQFVASAIIILLIKVLKNFKQLPWVTQESDKLNRVLAIVFSGAAALGIHHTFDPATGILTITGLTQAGILHGVADWIRSYALTEYMYQSSKGNGNGKSTQVPPASGNSTPVSPAS